MVDILSLVSPCASHMCSIGTGVSGQVYNAELNLLVLFCGRASSEACTCAWSSPVITWQFSVFDFLFVQWDTSLQAEDAELIDSQP